MTTTTRPHVKGIEELDMMLDPRSVSLEIKGSTLQWEVRTDSDGCKYAVATAPEEYDLPILLALSNHAAYVWKLHEGSWAGRWMSEILPCNKRPLGCITNLEGDQTHMHPTVLPFDSLIDAVAYATIGFYETIVEGE